MSYIHYDKKSDGKIYASVYESYREDGQTKKRRIENLGRVLDKENGIFESRGHQIFQYTIENGRNYNPEYFPEENIKILGEKLILDFGDTWFLKEYIHKLPFYESIANILSENSDTVFALLFFKLLTDRKASCRARPWYEGNYAFLEFSKANLTSQNISRVLSVLGSEGTQRAFLKDYLSSIYGIEEEPHGILIDSTGVPNATKMDITGISNHNGDVSQEVRVIYVIDRKNNMPIYFRYVAGNIVDVSTLLTTISELQQYGISINHVILDAGYCSEKNIAELLDCGIPFLTRLPSNKPLYQRAIKDNLNDLMARKYMFKYGERIIFIKKILLDFKGHNAHVYVCMDEDLYTTQHKKTMFDILDDEDIKDIDFELKKSCVFALVSSEDIPEKDILPLYYTRQQVEQVFDITKNYADLLPIRVQSEERFAGHLLLCFIATAIMQCIQKDLLKRRSKDAKNLNADSIWDYLRNQKCKVYDDFAIPQEAKKEVNTIYEIFKIKVPYKIPISK